MLADIEGQDSAIQVLRRALVNQRLHHAYLFSGPDGVGKGATAWALAQALLCTQPYDTGDGCGACNACVRVLDRQHPDVHVLERGVKSDGRPENQIKIAQVRILQRALSFKSFEGARRVVLLIEPERMNPATANALLKTLEEPGPGTHFALVTSAAHRLLPTIISRCQRLRFIPLSRSVVARQVAKITDIDDESADLLAGLAEGSIGKALTLVDSPWLTDRVDLIERVDDPRGLHKVPELLDFAEKLARQKESLPMVFHLLRTWYRDLLLVQQNQPADRLVHSDLIERLQARAPQISAVAVMGRIDAINQTERDIFERMANARLFVENLCLRLVDARR